MKIIFLFIACIITGQSVHAQLKTTPICPPLVVDILGGNVNQLFPKSAIAEIKITLPCFSEIVEKDSASRCIGIFYKDRDIHFYTDRKFIEIGPNFKGKITPALMGTNRSSLFTMLGYPKIKDISWDAFQMQYGTLVIYYNKAGKVNKLQISSKSTEALKLCE